MESRWSPGGFMESMWNLWGRVKYSSWAGYICEEIIFMNKMYL